MISVLFRHLILVFLGSPLDSRTLLGFPDFLLDSRIPMEFPGDLESWEIAYSPLACMVLQAYTLS